MEQDSAVASQILADTPGRQSPPEFNNEMVVAVRIPGGEPTKLFATDANRAGSVNLIDDREHSGGILPVIVAQPGTKTAQVFAVEEYDGLLGLDGSILSKNGLDPHGKWTEQGNCGEQGTRNQTHSSLVPHSFATSKRLVRKVGQ